MRGKLAVVLLALVVLSGCAVKRPTQTREEWLQTTTRTYQGVTKDQALNAVEKLFRLADGDDFSIVHTEEGIQATRAWSIYVIISATFGRDYWTVKAEQKDGGVKLAVQANIEMQNLTPMPTTSSGTWTAGTMPMAGRPINGTALYELFWARLDYLLGKSKEWMTCEVADKRRSEGITWGWNDPLCNSFNMTDSLPEELAAAKPQQVSKAE